jgi:diguanylate cyclase (GGDEF)-like protein/PAS domain S-box-containing protein
MRYVDVNATTCSLLGYSREEFLALGPQDVLPVSREELERAYDVLIADPERATGMTSAYRCKDGSWLPFESTRRALRSGEQWIIAAISRDITERRRAEERLAAQARYQERIARFGEAALAKRDTEELIALALRNVLEGFGGGVAAYIEQRASEREAVVRHIDGLTSEPVGRAAAYGADGPLARALEAGEAASGELPFGWAAGRAALLAPVAHDAGPRAALCAFGDPARGLGPEEARFLAAAASVLSAGLKRIDSESRLAYLAQFDTLTGLPNRALLADRFAQLIASAKRRGAALSVLFVDLDEFKLVNDTLGHAGGDELLKRVAARLQACMRAGDTVARISGDEFAVLLADIAKPEDAALVAQKIIERLGTPFEIRGKEMFATASIGIATFPADGADPDTLITAADAAMYRAKQSGRNTWQFFTADIEKRTRARALLGGELHRALERGEFRLVYQPKIDLKSGRPSGCEALLRWQHPRRGVVSPAEFIPILEEGGLIVPVGEWVLRQASTDIRAWQSTGLRPLPVAVNLSARQFRQADLAARVRALVEAAGVAAGLIELEITESQLMQDPDHAVRAMRSLSEAGIRIAIDDFGTGYSSLAYLTRFPLSALKIDRSFVAGVPQQAGDATIVRTIIEMAHALGFAVIAEGVENEDQRHFLRGLGCDQAQGYLFSRPVPAEAITELL